MSDLWPLGIAIYVAGTIGEAFGANLQRRSLTDEASRIAATPGEEPKGKFQQKLWVIGFLLFVFAGISMSGALFFATQTVLAPLQLFLFVSNAFFATWINKENFAWFGWDGWALVLVVTGVTMAVVAAPKHTEHYSNEEMVWLMRQAGFIVFCCFSGSFLIGTWYLKRRILASCQHDPRTIQRRWVRTVLNMSYGAIAGAFGGVNVTLTKTVFSLIVGEFNQAGIKAVLSSPLLWGTSFVLVGTYVLQIVVTVSGLEATTAIIVLSAHSVTEEVMATLGGILYFQDYLKFEVWAWIVFTLGNLMAIASVIGLSHLRLRDMEAKEREASAITAEDDTSETDNIETVYDQKGGVIIARKRSLSDSYLVLLDQNHRERSSTTGSENFILGGENQQNGPGRVSRSKSIQELKDCELGMMTKIESSEPVDDSHTGRSSDADSFEMERIHSVSPTFGEPPIVIVKA